MTGAENIAVFPLGMVLVPEMVLPLRIFEERYKVMLAECLRDERPFGINLIRAGEEAGGAAVPYAVGTVADVRQTSPMAREESLLVVEGGWRYRIEQITQEKPYLRADVQRLHDATEEAPPDVDCERLREAAGELLRLTSDDEPAPVDRLPSDIDALAWMLTARLPLENATRQGLLEHTSPRERVTQVLALAGRALATLRERRVAQKRLESVRQTNGRVTGGDLS